MKHETLKQILAAREAKRPLVVVSDLDTGEQWLFEPDADADMSDTPLDSAALRAACREALAADRSRLWKQEGGTDEAADGRSLFLQVHNPPLRMMVVGAVHITQALVPMAELLGYAVTVIDPRRAFASDERFPAVAVETDWPDEVFARSALDRRTAVVTLTHDPKIDDPALEAALASDVFYIGALGSTRTHAGRLERLRGRGVDEAALARIHAPIGLDIGAKSPAEIATSVAAEVTSALRRAAVHAPEGNG